uniref:type IV secretory system conjugative DNA transfer family protein n=1 Tax=Psychrobacter sp. TaxID=56811 RepID=UPI0015987B23|nr:type IV secretory system conjugative DNA transfer family protein [Psychrobacter sp.]QJS05205.1 Type IV secretory pathway, VirD4 component, or conjugative protein [Psychrobacter sp.]
MSVVIIVIILIVALAVITAWAIFLNTPKKSGIIYSASIDDKKELFSVLNYGSERGEPLISHAPVSDSKLKKDIWRDHLPVYSLSGEERGLVLGVSGSGKTTYLVAQLVDWMQSGKSLVVTDIKPEIWSILHANGVFERYGYEEIIINPTDALAHKYNAFDDIDDIEFATETIELIEILVGDIEFGMGAKLLLRAVLLDLKESGEEVSLWQVRRRLASYEDSDELEKDLIKSKSELVRELMAELKKIGGNERYVGSCFGAVSQSLRFLDNKAIANNTDVSDVSLRDVLQQPKKAIFLQFDQAYQEQTARLFGFTLAHVLRLLQMNFRYRSEVFVAIDEIINSAPIPRLAQKLNTMRSAKMPLFMYLQTLSGLNDVYGRDADKLFMSACSLKICYRVNENSTAREFSELVGDVDVEKWSSTEMPQVSKTGRTYTQRSINNVPDRRALIEPSELLGLETGDAIVIYKGKSARMTMPRYYEIYPMDMSANYATMSELASFNDYTEQQDTQ